MEEETNQSDGKAQNAIEDRNPQVSLSKLQAEHARVVMNIN